MTRTDGLGSVWVSESLGSAHISLGEPCQSTIIESEVDTPTWLTPTCSSWLKHLGMLVFHDCCMGQGAAQGCTFIKCFWWDLKPQNQTLNCVNCPCSPQMDIWSYTYRQFHCVQCGSAINITFKKSRFLLSLQPYSLPPWKACNVITIHPTDLGEDSSLYMSTRKGIQVPRKPLESQFFSPWW